MDQFDQLILPKGRDIPSLNTNDLIQARPKPNTKERNVWQDQFINEQIRNEPIHKERLANFGLKLRNPLFSDFTYKKSADVSAPNSRYAKVQENHPLHSQQLQQQQPQQIQQQDKDSLDNFMQLQQHNQINVMKSVPRLPSQNKQLVNNINNNNSNMGYNGMLSPSYNRPHQVPYSNYINPEGGIDQYKQILKSPNNMEIPKQLPNQFQSEQEDKHSYQPTQDNQQVQNPIQHSQKNLDEQHPKSHQTENYQSNQNQVKNILKNDLYIEEPHPQQQEQTLKKNQSEQQFYIPKIYKPYNIISNMRDLDYKPKYDIPGVTWDKYDRQKFKDFKYKDMSQKQIIKMKNQQQNIYQENTTANMIYGQRSNIQ